MEAQLAAAGMGFENLVKVTIYLADRRYRPENTLVRREKLGNLTPALTVIVAGLLDEHWRLEIEAVAVE